MADDRLKSLYEQHQHAKNATELARLALRDHVLSQPEAGFAEEIDSIMYANKFETLTGTIGRLETEEFRAQSAYEMELRSLQRQEGQQQSVQSEPSRGGPPPSRGGGAPPQPANNPHWWRQDTRSPEDYAKDQDRAAALAADLDDALGPKKDPGSGRR